MEEIERIEGKKDVEEKEANAKSELINESGIT